MVHVPVVATGSRYKFQPLIMPPHLVMYSLSSVVTRK
jgi:hypothetical protein